MSLDLAVTTDGPTRRRLYRHLPAYGIAVHHLPVGGRLYDLDQVSIDRDVDVGFVFPTRTATGAVLTEHLSIPWVNDAQSIQTTRNKAGVIATLNRADIPTPKTVHVASPVSTDEALEAFRHIDGPVVVKPNATTRGTGLVRVEDEDSFRGVIDYLQLIHEFPATGDRSFLVQSYRADARDIRVTLIDGVAMGAVERRRREDTAWVHNVHRGAEAVAIDPPDDVVEIAERTAAVLDVPLLGVDVLLEPDGPVVIEVNGRPTIDQVEKYRSGFYDRLAELIRDVAANRS